MRWPAEVEFLDPEDPKTDVWSKLTLETTKAQAGHADEDDDNDGSEVVYAYTIEAAGTPTGDDSKVKGVADSFKLEPTVTVDESKVGTGGVADIRAWLSPQPADKDADINTLLSYLKMPVTDPKATDPDGRILNFAECVTYLLFPYLIAAPTRLGPRESPLPTPAVTTGSSESAAVRWSSPEASPFMPSPGASRLPTARAEGCRRQR